MLKEVLKRIGAFFSLAIVLLLYETFTLVTFFYILCFSYFLHIRSSTDFSELLKPQYVHIVQKKNLMHENIWSTVDIKKAVPGSYNFVSFSESFLVKKKGETKRGWGGRDREFTVKYSSLYGATTREITKRNSRFRTAD